MIVTESDDMGTDQDVFSTDFSEVIHQVERIDPVRYGKTRNFVDGAVTRLSPYISRGMISTRQIFESLLQKGYRVPQMEKLVKELAWRDYWQQVWVSRGEEINEDLRQEQPDVSHHQMPVSIAEGSTGIDAVDQAIGLFYRTGYIHNHVRMYIASLACNVGKSHWRVPARWMYYSLFDGDWASNALSWQWVSGANSHKKYYANQENINRFCHTRQKGTFLDVDYEEFPNMGIPSALKQVFIPDLSTPLPETKPPEIDSSSPVLVYNSYNLDPQWYNKETANRVLLLEPSHFERYPVSAHTLRFILKLAQNISGIQVFTGEFHELAEQCGESRVYYKEHPLSSHYHGVMEQRDWMFDVKGYYRSYSAFWKKAEKQL